MAVNLRLLLVAASLQIGASLVDSTGASTWTPPKKALVATVLDHTQMVPADLMLGHHIRMLSSSRKNVAQVALINARVPGVDSSQGTVHDPVVAQLTRSYGTTGSVQVLELEADQNRQQELMRKIFSLRQGSSVVFAKKFFKQDLTSPDMKRQMAHFTAMMQFIDLCSQAEYGVELCINMNGESLLHRAEKKGVIELASELFENDEDVVALQPPSYCDYIQAHHRPAWAKKAKWTNSSFTKCIANATKARPEEGTANMVFNRQRLMAALPLSIDAEDLDLEKGFDHALMTGLKAAGLIKGMQCGHSFLIRAAGQESKCKGKLVHFQQQARSSAAAASKAGRSLVTDQVAGEYELFDQMVVRGIEVVVDRMERGMIPAPTGTVGDKCQSMCPSKERIKEGLAW